MYTELWGPSSSPSNNWYSYYIELVDDFYRYTWIYMLKHKSDAFNAFKLFQIYVSTQLSTKIKAL